MHKNEGSTLYKKQKKIINIVYFWHVELSSDYNIYLIQEFYNILGGPESSVVSAHVNILSFVSSLCTLCQKIVPKTF